MSKKGDRFVRLMREIKKLQLREIRLLESHCKLGQLAQDKLPSAAKLDTKLGYQISLEQANAIASVAYVLSVSYEDSAPNTPPAVFVSARFGVHYGITRPFSQRNAEVAVEHVATLNTWPYWRELAQSFTIRMGLPAFPLPLLSVTPPKTARRRKPPSK